MIEGDCPACRSVRLREHIDGAVLLLPPLLPRCPIHPIQSHVLSLSLFLSLCIYVFSPFSFSFLHLFSYQSILLPICGPLTFINIYIHKYITFLLPRCPIHPIQSHVLSLSPYASTVWPISTDTRKVAWLFAVTYGAHVMYIALFLSFFSLISLSINLFHYQSSSLSISLRTSPSPQT